MEPGKQFGTYLRGEIVEPFHRAAREKGLSPYALLAKAAEEYLRAEGFLEEKKTLDLSHRVRNTEGRTNRRRRGRRAVQP